MYLISINICTCDMKSNKDVFKNELTAQKMRNPMSCKLHNNFGYLGVCYCFSR